MNIPLPAGLFSNNAYFYPNNTYNLGAMSKPINATTLVSVDYSQLSPAPTGLSNYWFEADVGTSPPLVVSNPQVNGMILTFLISSGVPGVTYDIDINMAIGPGQGRTDTLTIEVTSSGDNGGPGGGLPIPQPGPPMVIPSTGNIAGFLYGEGVIFLNTGVRFFVSAVAPTGANILDQWFNSTTRVISELTTDGTNLIWVPFNAQPTPATGEKLYQESLTVTATNTLTPLTHGTYDGNSLVLYVNGAAFFPLGTTPPFHMSGSTVIWTSTQYTINTGDTVIAAYSYT